MVKIIISFLALSVLFGCVKGTDAKIKTIPACKVVFIAETGAYDKIPATIGEVYTYLANKKMECCGPCFGVYYNNPKEVKAEELKWEVCVPIKNFVADSTKKDTVVSRVAIKDLPETQVACLMYKGPYDKVGSAYKSLYGWVFRNRYVPAGPCREVYFNNPEKVPADSLLTELQLPVKKR